MAELKAAAALADLPEAGLKPVELEGGCVLLGRVNGQVVAWLDRCPHAGKPLRTGKCRNGELQCAWHGWTFDVETGNSIPDHPAFKLTPVPFKIENGHILVGI